MERKRIFAVIKVETAGKGMRNNRIIAISIVRFGQGVSTEKFESLVNPEQRIPNYVTQRSGIDDAMVFAAPLFSEIAEEVDRLTENAIFVTHNVSFDYHVVRSEFRYLGYNYTKPKLCTTQLSKKLMPGLFSYDLNKLCGSLGIHSMHNEQGMDKADATTILLERLCSLDENFKEIDSALRPKNLGSKIPSHIDTEQFNNLPGHAGIYTFQNREGAIIYVGKAKNIKKRVLSHFQNKADKEIVLCAETFSIDFESTGSELIALLLEADLIKKKLPKYNTIQKKTHTAYHIKSYANKKGIQQMAVEICPSLHNPTELFFTRGAAKKKLEQLCDEFNLCPKFMGLQRRRGRCSHTKFPNCKGVCCNQESVQGYNQRVGQALGSLKADHVSYLIHEKGRRHEEEAYVLVLEGVYQGFGFVDQSQQVSSINELIDLIVPRKNTYHTDKILNAYRKKNAKRVKVIAADP